MKKTSYLICLFIMFASLVPIYAENNSLHESGNWKRPYFSRSELATLEANLGITNVPKARTVLAVPDISKLNPFKTKLTPRKNVEINLFSSLRELFTVSILGLLGLVGLSGLFKYYRVSKLEKPGKIKGLD